MYKEVFNNIFISIFSKKIILIKALFFYLILSIIINYIMQDNISYVNNIPQFKSYTIHFISLIITYLVYLLTAISTHRILILQHSNIPTWGLFKFTKREWSFFKYGLLLGLIFIPIMLISSIFGIIIGKIATVVSIAIGLFIISIIVSRISLVFPAIAIDKKISFSNSWEYSKSFKLLVYINIIVFPILFSLAFGFVYGFVIGLLAKFVHSELSVLTVVLNMFITVFTVGSVSATYKYIYEKNIKDIENNLINSTNINDIIVEENDNKFIIKITNNHNIDFNQLKDKLKLQYLAFDYTNVVVNKEFSWMIRHTFDTKSYVSLSYLNDTYVIETYKTQLPNFLEDIKLKEK